VLVFQRVSVTTKSPRHQERRRLKGYSLNTVFDQGDVEIDQQPKAEAGEF
jgi:hypothetical protein